MPDKDNVIKILDKLTNINKELKLSADRLLVNYLNFATTIAHDLFYSIWAQINSTH